MQIKANLLMKRNIDALLRGRGQTRRDLARWCRRSDAWIAKIMAEDQREFPMKYFDRISDFFGIATYQLLQPGVSHLTERRQAKDRRSGADRRIGAARRLEATPMRQIDITPQEETLLAEWRQLRHADVIRLRDWIATRKD